MKLIIHQLFAIAMAIGMVACSSEGTDDPSGVDPTDISVSHPFIYKGTRASGDITSETIINHEFKVWGVATNGDKVFDGQAFTWSGSAWTYSPSKKWEDRTITFAAIAPTEDGGVFSISTINYDSYTQGFNISSIPMVQEISNDDVKMGVDFLVAEVLENRTQEDGELQFSFHHILTKLCIRARYQSGSNLSEVKITNMELVLPDGRATYVQGSGVPGISDNWVCTSNKTITCDLLGGEDFTLSKEYAYLPTSFFLAPNSDVTVKMNLKYSCYNQDSGETETHEYNDAEVQGLTTFKQGQIINLNLTLMPGELGNILFSPSIGEWVSDDSQITN